MIYGGFTMLRVAVAEDNPKDRERLLSFLKKYGEEKDVQIEVAEYTDGSELLDQYRPCYDVIFLDVEMPQMDGMKAAEKIRETDEEVILIFITNMAKYAIRGYEVQALDYVLKPVKLRSLYRENGQGKKACREEKRQKHQYKDRYGNPPSAAVPYPVCGGGTASLDIPHRGRGFFHKRCSEGCGGCAGGERFLQMQQVLSGKSSPCAKRP